MNKLSWYGMRNKVSKVADIDGTHLQILPTTHSDKYIVLMNLANAKFRDIFVVSTKEELGLNGREHIAKILQLSAKKLGIKEASQSKSVIAELGKSNIFDFKVPHLRILVHEEYQGMGIATTMFNISKSINTIFSQEISHSPSQLYFFMTKGYVPTSYHIFVEDKFEEHQIPEENRMAWMYSIMQTAKNNKDMKFFPFLVQLQHISMENGKKIHTLQKPSDTSRDVVMADIERLMARSSTISYRYTQKK